MKTLVIDESRAKQIYPGASTEFKAILEDTFTKQFFSRNTDLIKSYEDACEVLGIDPAEQYCGRHDSPDEIAYKKLKVIIRALNEEWTPDWNNGSQAKWWNWFYFDSPGFRFNYAYYDYSYSYVGSRLCFRSRELSEYCAKQFIDLYKQFYTL
ncbi:MAG TPA: hypothetical protein VMZ03_04005 [Chitinophagaceae bacterium]|nr:hypothetical protein [Chitinophagaceae bacterium]